MNLEELKAMKEKTDAIIMTLENDRKILKEARAKVIEDNYKELNEFLLSLCDYVKLISTCIYNDFMRTNSLFEQFRDSGGLHVFYSDDMRLCMTRNSSKEKPYLSFHCSGSEEGYDIDIYDDRVFFIPNEHRSNRLKEDFRKFILEHKEEFRGLVEEYMQKYFERLARDNKRENDSLYAEIEKLNRE